MKPIIKKPLKYITFFPNKTFLTDGRNIKDNLNMIIEDNPKNEITFINDSNQTEPYYYFFGNHYHIMNVFDKTPTRIGMEEIFFANNLYRNILNDKLK